MKTIKVKPVLLPTKEYAKIGDLVDVFGSLIIADVDMGHHYKQQLILISLEDDNIEEGAVVLWNSQIFEVCDNKAYSNTNFIRAKYCNKYNIPKVIATQNQLSPELIQQLVNEYNNGGMRDFEIEMVCFDELQSHSVEFAEMCENNIDYKPKLTNGFVTVVEEDSDFPFILQTLLDKKAKSNNTIDLDAYAIGLVDCYKSLKAPISYTEKEIFDLGDRYEEYCINCFGNLPESFSKWFNQNKKK